MTGKSDPHNFQRFLDAQSRVYDDARRELAAGRKRTHWMWFVFPQIAGLGLSPTSAFYAIRSLAEARAYLDDSVLGARLRECVTLTLGVEGRTARQIFGEVDAQKLRSSLTLFAAAQPDEPIFARALKKYYVGESDPATLARLSRQES